MLFKSNVPMSHRAAFFFAVILTMYQLAKWKTTSALIPGAMLPLICLWGIVVFHFVLRRYPGWQLGHAVGRANLVDRVGSRFEQLSVSARVGYWVLVIGAATLIYLVA